MKAFIRSVAVLILLCGVSVWVSGFVLMRTFLPLWLQTDSNLNARLLLAVPGALLAVILVEAARLPSVGASTLRLVLVASVGALLVSLVNVLALVAVCGLAGIPIQRSIVTVAVWQVFGLGVPLAVVGCAVLPLVRHSRHSSLRGAVGRGAVVALCGAIVIVFVVSLQSPFHFKALPAGGFGLMGGGKRVWSASLDGHVREYAWPWAHRTQDRTEVDINDDDAPDCIAESVTFGSVMVKRMRVRSEAGWRWLQPRVRVGSEWQGPPETTCRELSAPPPQPESSSGTDSGADIGP